MECGRERDYETYYKCNICNSLFCPECPHRGYYYESCCPSCGEPAGKNFGGRGPAYFQCMECGKEKESLGCYKCKICKGIFCNRYPKGKNPLRKRYKNRKTKAYCPSCGEPAGKNFGGEGMDYFTCMKCGKGMESLSCYKCKICNGVFCSDCPFFDD